MSTKKRLSAIKGFSDVKVEKVKEVSSKVVQSGFMTASEMSEFRKQVFRISTGSKELEYEIKHSYYLISFLAYRLVFFTNELISL